MGRKKQPHYRVVVADRAKARDGGFVESLGYYQPLTQPARVVLDLDRVDYWLEQGATPSDTVKTLLAKARMGGDETIAFGEVDLEEKKAREAEELAARRKAEKEMAEDEAKAEAEEAKAEAEAAKAKAEAEAAEAEAEEAEKPKAEAVADDAADSEDQPEAEEETEKKED